MAVGYVYVPVVVRSARGYVRQLEAADFHLFVDGRSTPFESFETGETAPVSLIVLQDLSGSMANGEKLETSRAIVRSLLDRARPGDEFELASFAGRRVAVDVPATSDRVALQDAVRAWHPYGTTTIQDAIARLPQIAGQRSGVRRAALLVTDGMDNASVTAADAAREIVRAAELPIYVLDLGGPRAPPGRDPSLDGFVTATGGRYVLVSSPVAVDEACDAVLADLRHQYVLGFSVGGAGAPDEHRLDVLVLGRGRRALVYRRAYHGLGPHAPRTGFDRGSTNP